MNELFGDNISNIRFIAWDTETTGVSTINDALVELAAVAFDEDFEHRRFETLVKPEIPIPPQSTRIHGITDSMVEAAPLGHEALSRFFEFLDYSGTPRVLIAHNAAFDVGMAYGEVRRSRGSFESRQEIVLDTCRLAKTLLPDLPSHTLQNLAAHFRIVPDRAHRALDDVLTLKGVFLKLMSIAADRCVEGGKGFNLEQLVELAGGYFVLDPNCAETRRRPFRMPPKIEALERLVGTETKIGIVYEVEEGYRYITPIAVKTKGFRVYVEAFCHRDSIKKTFRADKILKINLKAEEQC